MDGATLQRFIEERRRIDGQDRADLVAFRRGMLSVDEAISRGMGRQFERICLGVNYSRLETGSLFLAHDHHAPIEAINGDRGRNVWPIDCGPSTNIDRRDVVS